MTVMKVFGMPIVQRIFFSIGLLLWWSIWYKRVFVYDSGNLPSYFKVNYNFLLFLPIGFILLHIIILRYFSWVLVFILYLLLLSSFVGRLINDFLDYHGSIHKDYMNNIDSLIWVFMSLSIGFGGAFLLKVLKPNLNFDDTKRAYKTA